jgi:magnesium chelatase subunit D
MTWRRLQLALNLLAVEPALIGGLWLRARAGPLRQMAMDFLAAVPLPVPLQRLSPDIGDDALFGGLDPAATLRNGRPILRSGLLDRPAVFVLPMAERCLPGLAARLAQALDQQRHAVIALDEGAEAGEALGSALADRLGLFVDLDGVGRPDQPLEMVTPDHLQAARRLLPTVRLPHVAVTQVVEACAQLQISSTRAPLLALRGARILAALAGRDVVEAPDLEQAGQLVLAHRAAPLDSPDNAAPVPPPPAPEAGTDSSEQAPLEGLPAEILVEAARASLPDKLLEQLAQGRANRTARGVGGSGVVRVGNRRGRPLPARKGKPGGGAQLHLMATLRAAAPWQAHRRAMAAGTPRVAQALLVEPRDLHVRRNALTSDRVLIFAVDASGSSAVARLSEAKGAVELLLAQAYSRRDHVALLTFRGQRAELVLPPTRSLALTKQRLRGTPGGGATPLAHGLSLALATARLAQTRGMTPTIALLTDGRGNVALDGRHDRPLAEAQALQLARAIRVQGTSALVINVATRAQPGLLHLAQGMGARYIDLPRATAGRLAHVLEAALES